MDRSPQIERTTKMKSFVTAAALSLLAATAVQAAGSVAPGGVELRNASVTSPKERLETRQDVKTLSIGAPEGSPPV